MNHHQLHPPTAKPTNNPNPLSSAKPTTTTECGNCGSHPKWILHHVRLRGINRRLCTSCVLRLHPTSFCPSCFKFYDPSSSPHPNHSNRLTCLKCSSITHSNCVSNSSSSDPPPLSSSSSSAYLCPPCAKPNFSFFDLDSKPGPSEPDSNRAIDRKMAVVLLCAAKIASASMAKAVIVARADAERKVREAALARKRAREALEHVAFVVAKEKARRKELLTEVSGSGNMGIKEETNRNVSSMEVEKYRPGSTMGNANLRNAGMVQRRESSNGLAGHSSLTAKGGTAAAAGEGIRQKVAEVGCLQSNGSVSEKEKSANLGNKEGENGEVKHVHHGSLNGGGNISAK